MVEFNKDNPVFRDYRENILVDKDNPILAFKANRDRYTEAPNQRKYAGLAQLGSIYSEDALTWNVFRTLELKKALERLEPVLGSLKNPLVLVWTLAFSEQAKALQFEVGDLIRGIDGRHHGQITEPDVIIETDDRIIVVECKLGRPGERPAHLWEAVSEAGPRKRFHDYFDEAAYHPFKNVDFTLYESEGYQLFRMGFYAYQLGKKLGKKAELLSITNRNWWEVKSGKSAAREIWEKFEVGVDSEKLQVKNLFWQEIGACLNENRVEDEGLVELAGYMNGHVCLNSDL